jgi:hypothetical protein
VTKHLLCLTVDTDPDGLSGTTTNRQTLSFAGLERLKCLPNELAAFAELGRIPMTWFVRADGQLESILGTASYLLETYEDFWTQVTTAGDELAWHPHLYRQDRPEDAALLITDAIQAQDELERLWNNIGESFRPFHSTAFRNGEGWHTPQTYAVIERLGLLCDSTAIPGRSGAAGHPMNWVGTPNQPYFPSADNLCQPGPPRSMLELPMNTWLLQAPYDETPRVRYMNPAVHPYLFAKPLRDWENACKLLPSDLYVWVMIFHPDELLATKDQDALYSRSTKALCANLVSMAESLQGLGHVFEWTTVSRAAECWRAQKKGTSA